MPTLVIAGEEDPGLPAERFEAVLLEFLHDLDGPGAPRSRTASDRKALAE